MAREEDRDLLAGEAAHEVAHVAHPGRVETRGRLVEQEELRSPEQRRRDSEPLAHPVRVAADAVLRTVAQLDQLQHLLDAGGRVGFVVVGEQPQVLAPGEIRVEARPLDEAGDAVERLRAVDQRIAAEQLRLTGGGPDQAEQHPQQRGLSGSVRAEQAEDVAGRDSEIDAVDRDDLTVCLDDPAGGDGRRAARHLTARAAASAAAAGSEPASTYAVPPLCQASTVPSCVASSWALTPSSDTVGRLESGLLPAEPLLSFAALRSTSTIAPSPCP